MRNFRFNGFSVLRALGLAVLGAAVVAGAACREDGASSSASPQAPVPEMTAQGGVRVNPITARAVRPLLERYARERAEASAAPRPTAAPSMSTAAPSGSPVGAR